jgi:hypothetical protein
MEDDFVPKLNIIYKTLEEYIVLIDAGTPFSFSRYWDGEISCILGRQNINCDGCKYLPELREGLIKSITNQRDYFHAVNWPTHNKNTRTMQTQFYTFLQALAPTMPIYDFMVFQFALEQGRLAPLIHALRKRNTVLVSGFHLAPIDHYIPYKKFIEIYRVDAIKQKEKIKEDIRQANACIQNPFFIVCAGMASNVIIDELFPEIGKQCSMVDMGSVWDIFVGIKSRIWLRKISDETMRKNRGGL